jgi:hypothetical protein
MKRRLESPFGYVVGHGSRLNDWAIRHNKVSEGSASATSSYNLLLNLDNDGAQVDLAFNDNYILAGRIDGDNRYFSATNYTTKYETVSATENSVENLMENVEKRINLGYSSSDSDGSNALMGEVIYYNRALSDSERDSVISYLKDRWQFGRTTLTPDYLWVDAAAPATVIKDASNKVSMWKDRSGLRRDAFLQGSNIAPEWNSAESIAAEKPAILFNGNGILLSTEAVPTVSNITVFTVFKFHNDYNKSTVWNALIAQGHDSHWAMRIASYFTNTGTANFSWHIKGINDKPLLKLDTMWHLATAMQSGNVSTFYYSQADIKTISTDTIPPSESLPITIGNNSVDGGTQPANAYIAEIRIFARALTLDQRTAIENELRAKHEL